MENLLEVKNLQFSFRTYGGVVKAVRDVSFEVRPGEILGIVGESGCGKSTFGRTLLQIYKQTEGKTMYYGRTLTDMAPLYVDETIKNISSGKKKIAELEAKAEALKEILYKGKDVLKMNKKELRQFRGKEISYIFQDPMTSLNPTMRIGKQIEEVFVGRKGMSAAEKKAKALEILKMVGISDGERRYKQYPHELSGGMKQRVMIAIALVGSPSIVIADEPTTSLDVTIEAQILDVLKNLQKTLGTSIILITHDLGVIAKLCDRVLVMYGGKIVERGSVDEIFYDTAHPYTKGLMHSIAKLDTAKGHKLQPIEGTPPDLFAPPKGCPFAARCEYCMEICKDMPPQTYELSKEHETCCWLQHEYAPDTDMRRKVTEKGEV